MSDSYKMVKTGKNENWVKLLAQIELCQSNPFYTTLPVLNKIFTLKNSKSSFSWSSPKRGKENKFQFQENQVVLFPQYFHSSQRKWNELLIKFLFILSLAKNLTLSTMKFNTLKYKSLCMVQNNKKIQ